VSSAQRERLGRVSMSDTAMSGANLRQAAALGRRMNSAIGIPYAASPHGRDDEGDEPHKRGNPTRRATHFQSLTRYPGTLDSPPRPSPCRRQSLPTVCRTFAWSAPTPWAASAFRRQSRGMCSRS
jgi:hypothetical protein